MTDAAATFSNVTIFDGRIFPLGEYGDVVRRLSRGLLVGLGGVAATGLLITTVTVTAAWTFNAVLSTNPYVQSTARNNAGAMTLADHYPVLADARRLSKPALPPTRLAGASSFEVQWAGAMALASVTNGTEPATSPQAPVTQASIESLSPKLAELTLAPEITQAARLPALTDITSLAFAAAPLAALELTPPQRPKLEVEPARAESLPLPRPYPMKREIARLPSNETTPRVMPQVAMVAPPSAPAPQLAHNRAPAQPEADNRTAVYDIDAHTVYLPNGDTLEAHSGLGDKLDDSRYVRVKNRGPTPPNVYNLVLREQLFHGVQAVRLNPVDEGKMFGRDGMLAHTYMLGPNGQSNGCVSFRDYPRFLRAVTRGEVDRMVVVPNLANSSWRSAARSVLSRRRYADNDQ